jgi:hypothetical protein
MVRVVAHIDSPILHKLAHVTPSQLMALEPSLNDAFAHSMVSSLSLIFSGSHAPLPNARIKFEVEGGSGVQDMPLSENSGLKYDSVKNKLTTYIVDDLPLQKDLFKRSFVGNPDLEDSESQVGLANALNISGFEANDDFFVVHESDDHILSHPRTNQKHMVLFARDEKKGWRHHLISTVENAWQTVVTILHKSGIAIRRLIETLVSKIRWDDISHSTAFLSLFYRKLAPLSLFGIDLAKDIYMESLNNFTRYSDRSFKKAMKKLGVKDLSFASSSKLAKGSAQAQFVKTYKDMESMEADANTFMLQDRIVNSLPNVVMDQEGKSLVESIIKVCQDAGHDIGKAFDMDEFQSFSMPKLKFGPNTSFANMGLSKIVNLLRSAFLGVEHVTGHLLGSLMQIVPLYWNMALKFMIMPLKIPFLHDFWAKKFG